MWERELVLSNPEGIMVAGAAVRKFFKSVAVALTILPKDLDVKSNREYLTFRFAYGM